MDRLAMDQSIQLTNSIKSVKSVSPKISPHKEKNGYSTICDKHLIYSVIISRYWTLVSEYLALLSKILKKVNMNIFDITAKY